MSIAADNYLSQRPLDLPSTITVVWASAAVEETSTNPVGVDQKRL